jgi:hypothetical protein
VHQGQGSGEIHAVKWAKACGVTVIPILSFPRVDLRSCMHKVIHNCPMRSARFCRIRRRARSSSTSDLAPGSRRSTDRHSTSWWRSRWFISWKRPSGMPAVGGLTGGTPRTSCGGQPSDLLVFFVTEFHRSPRCFQVALQSFELLEIRHGLREHGHELEHRGHSPKLIMKARLHTRRRMQMRTAATSSGPLRQAGHYTCSCRARPNYGGKGKLSSFDCSPPDMWSQASCMQPPCWDEPPPARLAPPFYWTDRERLDSRGHQPGAQVRAKPNYPNKPTKHHLCEHIRYYFTNDLGEHEPDDVFVVDHLISRLGDM